MKTLLLLRHAKSAHPSAVADHDRPLNARGTDDAPRVAGVLRDRKLIPDAVLCSTAKRTRETAELVLAALGDQRPPSFRVELYLAPAAVYCDELRKLSDDVSVPLVVGHNPGIEELLHELTGSLEHMPTAALALIELPIDRWSDLANNTVARLSFFWRPRHGD